MAVSLPHTHSKETLYYTDWIFFLDRECNGNFKLRVLGRGRAAQTNVTLQCRLVTNSGALTRVTWRMDGEVQ